MKRRLDKKLFLSRETVRNLSERELLQAEGGATTGCSGTSSGSGCTGTGISDCHCVTNAGTCTSNWC